jgi:hypothetical protein
MVWHTLKGRSRGLLIYPIKSFSILFFKKYLKKKIWKNNSLILYFFKIFFNKFIEEYFIRTIKGPGNIWKNRWFKLFSTIALPVLAIYFMLDKKWKYLFDGIFTGKEGGPGTLNILCKNLFQILNSKKLFKKFWKVFKI